MHAQREGALARELLVHVVADEIAARMRHEGHVADRGDALLGHAAHLLRIGAGDVLLGEPLQAARQQLHRRRLAHDARELAVLVLIVAAALRGHGIAGDAERFEGTAVQPQRVAVARVHDAGAVRERLVDGALCGRRRRVPAVVAPTLGDHPGVGRQAGGELLGALHQFRLARAHMHEQKGRGAERGMEEMQVGVVEAGAHEGVAEVVYRGVRGHRRENLVRLARIHDAIARHRERQVARRRRIRSRREHLARANYIICLDNHFTPPLNRKDVIVPARTAARVHHTAKRPFCKMTSRSAPPQKGDRHFSEAKTR